MFLIVPFVKMGIDRGLARVNRHLVHRPPSPPRVKHRAATSSQFGPGLAVQLFDLSNVYPLMPISRYFEVGRT